MDEQIRRQRELILQMDSHYQKQVEFLKSRIEKLQEQIRRGEEAQAEDNANVHEPVKPNHTAVSNGQDMNQKPVRAQRNEPLPKLRPL